MAIIKGIKKYIYGYYEYGKHINGMNPLLFTIDGIWCKFRYGCVFNQFTEGGFYKYRGYQRNNILTYRNWLKVIKANNPNDIHYFKNKVDFNIFYQSYIGRDWLHSVQMSKSEFSSFIEKHHCAIIKPIDDWEGNGICLVHFDDYDVESLYKDYKSKNILIEEVVKQHNEMMFNNKSVNTIRVYSIFDSTKQKAFIIKTALRAGVGNSIVDNSHGGGMAYEVDVESGHIISSGWSHIITDNIIHPGSNICMLGRTIPYWNELKIMVTRAAEMMPSVKFIGWDVAITDNGPLLIEGNHDPDLDIMEFVGHSGYLPIIKQHLNL